MRSNQRVMVLLACFAVWSLATGIASPATYYLSPSGQDSSPGTANQPWATFGRAWRTIAPGDTLILKDGTYRDSLEPPFGGQPGLPITIKAQNDGQAVIDGESTRPPILLYNYRQAHYFIIEGIVVRNGRPAVQGVITIETDYNILRRVSAYNAHTDYNTIVISLGASADYNLIEDCIAAGSGRKMINIYKGQHNVIRRCLAYWTLWDGRQSCSQEWPQVGNIHIYNASNNIIENGVAIGPVAEWSVMVQANAAGVQAINNKVLGTVALNAGINPDGSSIEWPLARPQPSGCDPNTIYDYVNWPAHRVGFMLWGQIDAELRDNVFRDVVGWGNASYGFSAHASRNFSGNVLERATITRNGLDLAKGGGPGTDALEGELNSVTVLDSRIDVVRDFNGKTYPSRTGSGADVRCRYVNGVLMDGSNGEAAQPLWPWPMEDRARRELGISVTNLVATVLPQQVSALAAPAEPHLQISPMFTTFGVVVSNSPQTREITLANTGGASLTIQGYGFERGSESPFAVLGGTCPAAPFVLGPSQSCKLQVEPRGRFNGVIADYLVFNSNGLPNYPYPPRTYVSGLSRLVPNSNPLPGVLECEQFHTSSGGFQIKATADNNGSLKISGIQSGASLEYPVAVAQSGTYAVTARVASASSVSKSFSVLLDGKRIAQFAPPATGGWEKFVDTTVGGVALAAGSHTLRIEFETGGFDLNHLLFAVEGTQAPSTQAPSVSQIQFPGEVAGFSKFEVTFQVDNSVAQNPQWPYDPSPPAGIAAGAGISVDLLVTPDNWKTVYTQPAFYYQEFVREVRSSRRWFYPTENFAWKARFSPHRSGGWQFKIRVRDGGGSFESETHSFVVAQSTSRGFVRVSKTDPRYFEFDDGSYFPGLGYGASNLTEKDFQTMQKNGIQLIRTWWTSSSIFGSQWNPYYELRNQYLGYVPRTGLFPFQDDSTGRTLVTMRIDYEPEGNTGWFDGCRVLGSWGTPTEVKPNTTYRISVRYRGFNITGPRITTAPPYGFVVKTGLSQPGQGFQPGTGVVLTNYGANTPAGWETLEGTWSSGSYNFLPPFYFLLENVTGGQVYVESISMKEDLGNGRFGPEIMHKPSMDHLSYFQQHNSCMLDEVVSWAEQYGVCLKPVILEKGEKITRKIAYDGSFVADNEDHFYGDYRNVTKVRWLQQTWWRYLQARWGYSPSIHSWELCNEGDPFNDRHYALADEMGKYMKARVFGVQVETGDGVGTGYRHPNAHMVTTSFWHSMPSDKIWANPKYPNIDYADVHAYISTGWLDDPAHETDAALYHLDYSKDCRGNIDYSATRNSLATKPVIRGEAGIDFVNSQQENPDLSLDSQGTWLHNYVWAGLDAGALHELYWWTKNRETQPGPDGQPGLHEIYRPYYDFVRSLPLNNGRYQDLQPTVSNQTLRVVGQKDMAAGRAHLWIQNKQHTWRNVVDKAPIAPASGQISLAGFSPGVDHTIEWWDTYATAASPTGTTIVRAGSDGSLVVSIESLTTDIAVKVFAGGAAFTPTPPEAPSGLKVVDALP